MISTLTDTFRILRVRPETMKWSVMTETPAGNHILKQVAGFQSLCAAIDDITRLELVIMA